MCFQMFNLEIYLSQTLKICQQSIVPQLLDKLLAQLTAARSRQAGLGRSDTAQLVLILSDGRGVFREGMEVVRRAVRRARAAHAFLVFVVMDNPDQKVSPYIDHFQMFPFLFLLQMFFTCIV